jgi:hypothetical protein
MILPRAWRRSSGTLKVRNRQRHPYRRGRRRPRRWRRSPRPPRSSDPASGLSSFSDSASFCSARSAPVCRICSSGRRSEHRGHVQGRRRGIRAGQLIDLRLCRQALARRFDGLTVVAAQEEGQLVGRHAEVAPRGRRQRLAPGDVLAVLRDEDRRAPPAVDLALQRPPRARGRSSAGFRRRQAAARRDPAPVGRQGTLLHADLVRSTSRSAWRRASSASIWPKRRSSISRSRSRLNSTPSFAVPPLLVKFSSS